ncbi:MAG: phenylalanine--tRNA ligase subunit beta [Patescibacteria group bacterium]|jgi:phenylalanyl-tRNA synthetase beta chain
MKFSYNYLKKILKFKKTPQEIAELMDLHITEVESVLANAAFTKVVVGEILEIRDHPNADKLHLTKVDIGTETLNVVCGAANIAVGQKVPLALVGAVLPNGLEIKEAVIRGEKSFGMICSETELGLADKSDGILVLRSSAIPGTPVEEILDTNTDTIIEPKILSNRPDFMSYVGMSRELAAVLNIDYQPTIDTKFIESNVKTMTALAVKVEDTKLCPRYLGRVVRNITVKSSPKWMQDVLNASGLRPINNIVDIANFVMLELGNPIHTFDYAKVGDGEVVVRNAHDGETLVCLDGVERKLDNKTLIIADSKNPIAIAGIIGGEESGVSDQTRDLVVEVAAFEKTSIRRTSKRLGIATDAELHFERGVTPLSPEKAMERVLNLIQADSPACEILAGNLDVHGKLPSPFSLLRVSVEGINQLLGITISAQQMAGTLNKLDLPTEIRRNDLVIKVPAYRADIVGMSDIAEEVLRIYGADQIPFVMPQITGKPFEMPEIEKVKMQIRELMVRLGFTEVYTHPFDDLKNDKHKVAIKNPLSEGWVYLVDNLSTNLVALDINRPNYRIFELGTTFHDYGETLPAEEQQLAVLIKGADAYRIARGVVDQLIRELGLNLRMTEFIHYSGLLLQLPNQDIVVGSLSALDEHRAAFVLEISRLMPHIASAKHFIEINKFPAIKMDMAFIIRSEVRIGELQTLIQDIDKLVDTVELFDVFELPKDGNRSVAFHIELRANDRTLTNTERDDIHAKIVEAAKVRFDAKLRE